MAPLSVVEKAEGFCCPLHWVPIQGVGPKAQTGAAFECGCVHRVSILNSLGCAGWVMWVATVNPLPQ